jgi:hypothetical protein
LEKIQSGEEQLTEEQKSILRRAIAAAKKIEKKYGRKNLGWDDFEWGLVSGRMSALAWVMGRSGMNPCIRKLRLSLVVGQRSN